MSVPREAKELIYHQTIHIEFAAAAYQTMNLHCPFIPDKIYIRAAEADTGPNNSLFHVESDLFGMGEALCVYAADNSYNPVYEYSNPGRDNISGQYMVGVRTTLNNALADVDLVLHIKYVRYNI